MPEPGFVYEHRVTYADCTMGNHVYYGRYLPILEAARGEFFRHLKASFQALQDQGFIFPVCECRLKYRAPARYDELLRIRLWMTLAKGVRLNFAYTVHREDGLTCLEAETLHACTGIEENPRRIPPHLLQALAPYISDVDAIGGQRTR